MPNQYNFRSDVTNTQESRYTASRVVKVPSENIFFETIPASFGFDEFDNIELHFYTDPGNTLTVSTVINLTEDSDVLKTHVVMYDDQSYKNNLRIDFTKLFEKKNLVVLPGQYRMVLNFFSNEIGSYDDRKLFIQTISPSRTEVELSYYPTQSISTRRNNQNELEEFVQKSFDKPVSAGVAEKIFKSGVTLDDPTEGVTYETVVDNIEIESIGQTFENTIQAIQNINGEDNFSQAVDEFITSIYDTVVTKIALNGDRRIQEDEFQQFIAETIDETIFKLNQTTDRRIVVE